MRLHHLNDLSEASDEAAFRSQLLSLAEELNFELMTAMIVYESDQGPPLVFRVSNTPQAFLEASVDAEASARDPVLKRLKNLSVPFLYDRQTYLKEGAEDLYDAQAQYGYKNGVGVGLHIGDGRHFILSFDRESPLPSEERSIIRLLGDLQLLAVHAQTSALRLFRPAEVLTERERIILEFTSQGKSAKVIGGLLNCAEVTVNFHLARIRGKFGVSSKHQAVLRARALGLL